MFLRLVMQNWNEFGVTKTADDSTYRELLTLRSIVRELEDAQRDRIHDTLVDAVQKISETLERIERKL